MTHTELPFARDSRSPAGETTFVASCYTTYAALAPAVLLSDILSIILASIALEAGYTHLTGATQVCVEECISLALSIAALTLPVSDSESMMYEFPYGDTT